MAEPLNADLMPDEQLLALHRTAANWDSKVAGVDHAWNVYEYVGASVLEIEGGGPPLLLYRVVRGHTKQAQPHYYGIPASLVLVCRRTLWDPARRANVLAEAHLIARVRNAAGEPEIVFASERDPRVALLPLQSTLEGVVVAERRDLDGRRLLPPALAAPGGRQ